MAQALPVPEHDGEMLSSHSRSVRLVVMKGYAVASRLLAVEMIAMLLDQTDPEL